MVRKQQWVMSAADVAEFVASIAPRIAQRSYLVADGGELNSVVVVTSLKTSLMNGFSVDNKDVIRVNKSQIESYLAAQGETLPRNTKMFVRPDPALLPTITTALEVVITDDTNLGGF